MPDKPDKGTITLTDDDLAPVDTPPPGDHLKDNTPTPTPTWWDRVNKGLISPEQFLKWASGGKVTIDQLEKSRDQPPSLKESPSEAFSRTFHSGFLEDLTKTASSLTSPVSVATGALSQAAKLPGAFGKVARSLLAAEGVGFGAQGASRTIEGVRKGVTTPEGSQEALSGLSQVASAAPGVAQTGRYGKAVLSEIAPQLFAKGEGAFVAALAPPKNAVPKLRSAYQNRAAELKSAPIKDLPDLNNYAESKRVEAATELNRELVRVGAPNVKVIPVDVADTIRQTVTKSLELSSPREAQAIRNYANRVEKEFSTRPINLGEAEAMVQELNARSAAFDKLPPEAQRQALAEGNPILGEKALKEALQDQIESRLSPYRDLKRRYGDWKEIQNQTQARIDDLDRHGTSISWMQRRGLESLFEAGGMFFGARHGGGVTGGVLGGVGGYLLSRFAADQMLTRLSSPERALSRGLATQTTPRPLPFAGQIAQPVAGQIGKDNQ